MCSIFPQDLLPVGPILQLRTFGLFCPLLETEGDHNARIALCALQDVPIKWYLKGKPKCAPVIPREGNEHISSSISPKKGFVSGLLSNIKHTAKKNASQCKKDDDFTSKNDKTCFFVSIDAVLNVVDVDGLPTLRVESVNPMEAHMLQEELHFPDFSSKIDTFQQTSSTSEAKITRQIPLRSIDSASIGTGFFWEWKHKVPHDPKEGVKIYGVSQTHRISGIGRKLVQFDVMPTPDREYSIGRDDVVHYVNVLSRWDRTLQLYESEVDDENNYVVTSPTSSID